MPDPDARERFAINFLTRDQVTRFQQARDAAGLTSARFLVTLMDLQDAAIKWNEASSHPATTKWAEANGYIGRVADIDLCSTIDRLGLGGTTR